MVNNGIEHLELVASLIFILAPVSIIAYIFVQNQRKKRHILEKQQMKLTFESELSKTQLEIQEQTMQTIGADLHDNIGQLLSLTSLTLRSIEQGEEAKARQKIDDSVDLTLRSIKEMRLLGKLLQGDQLVALGLSEAIRHEISWLERSGKYRVVYKPSDELPAAGNPDKDLILFRILQEVINNIIKHASATEINIALDYFANRLHLLISDNGVGFDTESTPAGPTGMGLQNIRKRAAIIGGEANIVSNPGEGSLVSISILYP